MSQPTLTARLLRRADLTTVVAPLPLSRERHWQDQLNEPGTGSLVLQDDDPAAGLVQDGDVVQFLLDGTVVFAFLVRSREHVALDPHEAPGQLETLSGPGLLSVLDEAVVYPSPGADSVPVQDARVFSWPAYEYDDSAWGSAVELVNVGGTARGPTIPGGPLHDTASASYWADTNITEWPEGAVWFIWTATGPGAVGIDDPLEWAPEGEVYFRKRFTVPANVVALNWYVIFDAVGEVYLDGVPMADGDYGVEPNINTFSGTIKVSPGDHEFAAKVTNDVDPESDEWHNPGAFALVAYAADATGATIGSGPVVATDASWKVLPYPPAPPGMTPGEALLAAVNEAQARGALGGVVPTFTRTVDSAGTPWPVVADISTQVGNDVLAFARELAETYLDVWADPATLELSAWVQDGRGETKAVTLQGATDPTDALTGNVSTLTHTRVL